MGMRLTIAVPGPPASQARAGAESTSPSTPPAADATHGHTPQPAATVDPSFQAFDPALPPLGPDRVHQVTLRAQEVELDVAPGMQA